jgi:hypothetical protein
MKKFVIELSDVDYNSLLVDMISPEELFTNFVTSRVDRSQSKIIKIATDWHIRNEKQLPVKKEDIIKQAFDNGLVLTLEERAKQQRLAELNK